MENKEWKNLSGEEQGVELINKIFHGEDDTVESTTTTLDHIKHLLVTPSTLSYFPIAYY